MNQNFALVRASVPTVSQIQSYIEENTFFKIIPSANTRLPLGRFSFPNNTAASLGDWRQFLLGQRLETNPWPHLVSKNFLPPRVYDRLTRNLPRGPKPSSSPSRTWMTTTPDFFNDRQPQKYLYYSEEEMRWWGSKLLVTLGELTCMFCDATTFKHLLMIFKGNFSNDITTTNDRDIFVQVRITHDRDDYDLDVHLDLPEKFLSILVYLPIDETSTAGGTSLYTPKPQHQIELTTTEHKGYKYFPTSMFNLEKKVPFSPNTGFVFLRTDDSWHGKPLDPSEFRTDRFTLQINYFRKSTSLTV